MGLFCCKKKKQSNIIKISENSKSIRTFPNKIEIITEASTEKEINKKAKEDSIDKEKSSNIFHNIIMKYTKSNKNELKITLYPENKPRYDFNTESLEKLITKDTLGTSLNINRELAYINSKVPVLNGFYEAHKNHLPIRIKPDDIWLLIVQAFSNHVNYNSEKLRNMFVNFDGKKTLQVKYRQEYIHEVNNKMLENFSKQINEQMEEYLGKEILDILTPNFTTTDKDKIIIFKISIMGAFKKYFNYDMFLCGCGLPYIILEGTAEDFEKILKKAKKLSKYDFSWYVDRIIPIIQKFIDAKRKKIDNKFFKNIVQDNTMTEKVYRGSGIYRGDIQVPSIKGWILKFFAYYNSSERMKDRFDGNEIKIKHFEDLANQMLIVPFTIIDRNKKKYLMKYSVGFVGCDKNENNEVFPVSGWIVSPSTEKERESKL